jgi:adenylylsulfate kinase
MKILICGLPGAGKTHLAERLIKNIESCAWFNADVIRQSANDWDFSAQGRQRQSSRMKAFADFEVSHGRVAVCDFVAPTQKTRDNFEPDITIWLDTIAEGRYQDTNKMFERLESADYHITKYLSDEEIESIANDIQIKRIKQGAIDV